MVKAASGQSVESDIVYRLEKRAEIRRQIPTRKSVQLNEPDRIADLLEEAAEEIKRLRQKNEDLDNWIMERYDYDDGE